MAEVLSSAGSTRRTSAFEKKWRKSYRVPEALAGLPLLKKKWRKSYRVPEALAGPSLQKIAGGGRFASIIQVKMGLCRFIGDGLGRRPYGLRGLDLSRLRRFGAGRFPARDAGGQCDQSYHHRAH